MDLTEGEAQDAYAAGGRAALFSYLVERVYAHLDANEIKWYAIG